MRHTNITVSLFRVDFANDILTLGEFHQIRQILNSGGLCIVPSDTCYAIAAKPLYVGTTQLIDALLDRKGIKISLSFGSQAMLERFVVLGYREYRIIDGVKRTQPVTLVAPVNPDLPEQTRRALPEVLLNDSGDLGVRISGSFVERILSSEMDHPLTTVAIYYDDGKPVRNLDDAIGIVTSALMRLGKERVPVAAIQHPTIQANALSTVVGFSRTAEQPGVVIYREGDVSRKVLVDLAGNYSSRDVEDWT